MPEPITPITPLITALIDDQDWDLDAARSSATITVVGQYLPDRVVRLWQHHTDGDHVDIYAFTLTPTGGTGPQAFEVSFSPGTPTAVILAAAATALTAAADRPL